MALDPYGWVIIALAIIIPPVCAFLYRYYMAKQRARAFQPDGAHEHILGPGGPYAPPENPYAHQTIDMNAMHPPVAFPQTTRPSYIPPPAPPPQQMPESSIPPHIDTPPPAYDSLQKR
ncbi:hypothetical protein BC940DRAFT_330154 [Gongronella butleri]|nr:hypothetical protein BC940DRAFT_330154 [Gongronella butleri]